MSSTLPPCCIGIALLLSACRSTTSVEPLDSKSLIGVWSGRVTAMDKASVNTKMILTITRVTGSSVFGRAEIYPYRRPPFSWPFRGTLEGNELQIHAWKLTVFLIPFPTPRARIRVRLRAGRAARTTTAERGNLPSMLAVERGGICSCSAVASGPGRGGL